MPTWLLPTLIGLVLAAVAVHAAAALTRREDLVRVPSVVGLDAPVARSRLAQIGLLMEKGDTRFSSTVPRGYVIEQRPPAGSELSYREAVVVVVSAGSEEFVMPDVVGMSADEARDLLGAKGVSVKVEPVSSPEPTATVLSSVPGPGVRVSSTDVVRLRVSSGQTSADVLLPYPFANLVIVVDPSPVATGSVDAPLEVARKLRSLLEASGARVAVTRTITDTDTSEAARVTRAREASASSVVALSFPASGRGGVQVLVPRPESAGAAYTGSALLADAVVASLSGVGEVATRAKDRDDPVIGAVGAPGVAVVLGSQTSKDDVAAARDPRWSDRIARALYIALGESLAPRPE